MEHPRISIDPDVVAGKPCVAGTRISVQLILNMLAAGDSRTDVLAGYQSLQDDDISAALRYAADCAGVAVRQAAK